MSVFSKEQNSKEKNKFRKNVIRSNNQPQTILAKFLVKNSQNFHYFTKIWTQKFTKVLKLNLCYELDRKA
jgi:hypothetical protein